MKKSRSFFGKTTLSLLLSCAVLGSVAAPLSVSAKDLSDHAAELQQFGPTRPSPSPEPAPSGEAAPPQDLDITPAPGVSEDGTLSPSLGDSLLTQEDSHASEQLNALLAQLEAQFPTANGSWSCYVCDLNHGTEGSLHNGAMQSASLIKLFIMGAVYEQYDSLTSLYGKDSIDSLLYWMITVSDNDASNTLTTYLGGGDSTTGRNVVTQYCLDHGYPSTSMGRMLLAPADNGDNYTSAEDCGLFLKRVYEASQTEDPSMPHASDMYNLLSQQTRRNKIPAQMPSEVKIANKTGELSDVENDAAILSDPANNCNLVLVFLSQNLSDAWSAQNTIASLSRFAYDSSCSS